MINHRSSISLHPRSYHHQNSDDVDLRTFQTSLKQDKVACIGAGYVGGPTMAVMAKNCPDITFYVTDVSDIRIQQWNSNKLPIYEPGLDDIVKKCRNKNLFFTTKICESIQQCDIIFLCVNTPTKLFGTGKGKAADLSAWELASRSVASYAQSNKIVIEKSTVPVRTAESLYRVLETNSIHKFVVLSNPEFLAEGSAINDLEYPDRVLIGGREESVLGQFAMDVLTNLYKHWVPEERIICTSVWSSELAKLVANAMLAQRVTSINAVSMLCEKTGADIRQVAKAIGADTRIGRHFLNASVGFGGSCLQKDVLSLAYLCDFYGLHEAAEYWQRVKDMNDLQKSQFASKIIHKLFNTVRNKKIAVFGFSYKKNTSDTRATPALDVCATLMEDGATIHVFDPRVERESARQEFINSDLQAKKRFDFDRQFLMESSPENAVKNSHAIVILTEWDVFTTYDYAMFYNLMKKPAFIFDGRNILNHSYLVTIGFEVYGIGVPDLHTTPF